MGTLIEELAALPDNVNIAVLVIDTMGIFWTMRHPNTKEKDILSKWGFSPAGTDIELYVPEGSVGHYEKMHIDVKPFSIPPSELSGYDWCSLFGLDPISPMGVFIMKTIEDIKENAQEISLKTIMDFVKRIKNRIRLCEMPLITIFALQFRGEYFMKKGLFFQILSEKER